MSKVKKKDIEKKTSSCDNSYQNLIILLESN